MQDLNPYLPWLELFHNGKAAKLSNNTLMWQRHQLYVSHEHLFDKGAAVGKRIS